MFIYSQNTKKIINCKQKFKNQIQKHKTKHIWCLVETKQNKNTGSLCLTLNQSKSSDNFKDVFYKLLTAATKISEKY